MSTLKERAEESPFSFSSPLRGKKFCLLAGPRKERRKKMNSRRIVGTIGIVGTVLAVLLLPFWSQNDEVQAQGQYHVFLPAVLNVASPNQPTVPLPEPSPTPLPEKREFNLSLNLREQAGVTILNDRPDWDGKANSIVSLIVVDGTAEFLFQRWGPPGKWDTIEAEKTVSLEGTVNLAEYEQGVWNDTLQKVTIAEGDIVVLSEESDGSGITIILVG